MCNKNKMYREDVYIYIYGIMWVYIIQYIILRIIRYCNIWIYIHIYGYIWNYMHDQKLPRYKV